MDHVCHPPDSSNQLSVKMSKHAVQHNTEVQVDKISVSTDMLIRQSKQNWYEWKTKMSKQAVSAGLMKQTMTTRSSSAQIMQRPPEYQAIDVSVKFKT